VKQNVGRFDQYIRITGGLTMLGMGIRRDSPFLMMMGSMKVAEGITRWCPMLHILGLSTKEEDMSQDIIPEEILESMTE
jgi:hypothetical protein